MKILRIPFFSLVVVSLHASEFRQQTFEEATLHASPAAAETLSMFYYSSPNALPSKDTVDDANFAENLGKIQDRYIHKRKEDKFAYGMARVYSDATWGLAELAVSSAGPAGAVGGKIIVKGLEKVTQHAIAEAEAASYQSAVDIVSSNLKNVDPALVSAIKKAHLKDPAQARELALEAVRSWNKNLYAEIKDPQERAVIEARMNSALVESTISVVSGLASGQRLQGEELKKQSRSLFVTQVALSQYARETNYRLNNIANTQKEILNGVKEIHESSVRIESSLDGAHSKLDRIQSDVGFANQFLFGQASTSEKLRSLKQGMFPDMDPKEKEDLIKKYTLIEKQEKLTEQVGAYLNGADQLAGIVSKLPGFDPKLAANIQKIASKGRSFWNGASQFMRGDYLGGINSVLGGLFGGGPSIEEQRHQQIMGQLDALAAGQKVLLENQAAMFENQRKILEGIRAVSEQIFVLSQDVLEFHQKQFEKLDLIHEDLIINRSLLLGERLKEISDCTLFFDESARQHYLSRGQKVLSYSNMQSFFSDHGAYYSNCLNALQRWMTQDQLTDPVFSLSFWEKNQNTSASRNERSFLNRVYRPIRQYYVERLGLPPEILDNFYDANVLLHLSDLAIKTYPWIELTDKSNSTLMDIKEISALDRRNLQGLTLLNNTLKRVDEAIFQESLMSGSKRLFEKLYADLGSSNENSKLMATQILNLSPLLTNNFIRWAIRHELSKNKQSVQAYSLGLGLNHRPGFLRKIMGTQSLLNVYYFENLMGPVEKLEISFGKTFSPGWYAQIGNSLHALHDVESVSDEKMSHRHQLEQLQAMREKIVDHIVEWNFYRNASSKDKAILQSVYSLNPFE